MIAVAKKPFPEVAAQAVVNNSGDPLEFLVSPSAPPNHAIALTLTLEQGGVARGRQVLWVTTQ